MADPTAAERARALVTSYEDAAGEWLRVGDADASVAMGCPAAWADDVRGAITTALRAPEAAALARAVAACELVAAGYDLACQGYGIQRDDESEDERRARLEAANRCVRAVAEVRRG